MAVIDDIWNEVIDTWNGTLLYWNLIVESYINAGKAPNDYLDWNAPPEKKAIKEEFIKIFITVHNQFLTEEQKKLFKIANLYPTYEEQFKIKKQEQLVLKEYKLKNKANLKKSVNVTDIKIGLKKIEENVRNKPKK